MTRAATVSLKATSLDADLAPLVRAAAAGDAGAFGRLIDASRNAVTAITLAISRDVAASEDIAQEVYLVVWRRLAELRNPASFLPWVRQIARYTARTWRRDRRTLERRIRAADDLAPADASLDGLLERAADARPDPEARLLDAERDTVVRAALDELPDEAREVLILFYREGRSSRQVARLLGLSDAAARKRLQRARAALTDDVLRRFADVARRSAPGAAFTAAVVAATASAPTAAAAGLAGAAASKSLGSKLVALLGAGGLGFLGGAAGVIFGLRRDFADAVDAHERRQLHLLRALALGALVVACLGFASPALHIYWFGPVSVFTGLVVALWALYLVWLPKLLYRRFLVEEQGDESAARRRLAARRRQAWIGLGLGTLGGSIGLIGGMLSAGLL
ncbi:MAG: sigma-70 family RNA polymerase sigma factor [Acidobacteriota bacterium]